ncbi:MAG: DUF2934 domain-containing protein [Nitrospira sp.]|nr:DUF2934 domain-containing protein [Nitrospira sp.]
MARRTSGEQREANSNGPRASDVKVGGMVGARRAGQRESPSVGPTNGRSEAHTEGQAHLHRQIAELAYVLYERSGFRNGNDLDHWLEAERQIKESRGQAA